MEGEGATALAAALRTDICKLTSLDLASNYVGDVGATALAAALRTEACLDLASNDVRNEGATALAMVLRTAVGTCKLTRLNLRENDRVGEAGEMALVAAHFTLPGVLHYDFGIAGTALSLALRTGDCKLTPLQSTSAAMP